MTPLAWPRRIAGIILGAVFPEACVICGAPGSAVCTDCETEMDSGAHSHCRVCGGPPFMCRCRAAEYIDGLAFPYFYSSEEVKSAIGVLKRRNNLKINRYFSEKMYASLTKNDKIDSGNIDMVTNVPRKRRSVGKYGYDQTKNLARLLADKIGTEYGSLLTVTDYTDQKILAGDLRAENVRDKFRVKDPEMCAGRSILLTDDVLTTGATLSECARMLKESGAAYVYAVCAAAAQPIRRRKTE